MCARSVNWPVIVCQDQLRTAHDRLSRQRLDVEFRKSGSIQVIRHPGSSEAEVTALEGAQYRYQSHCISRTVHRRTSSRD
jgi:hypothetical protein